jgi:hypothetical protein
VQKPKKEKVLFALLEDPTKLCCSLPRASVAAEAEADAAAVEEAAAAPAVAALLRLVLLQHTRSTAPHTLLLPLLRLAILP